MGFGDVATNSIASISPSILVVVVRRAKLDHFNTSNISSILNNLQRRAGAGLLCKVSILPRDFSKCPKLIRKNRHLDSADHKPPGVSVGSKYWI